MLKKLQKLKQNFCSKNKINSKKMKRVTFNDEVKVHFLDDHEEDRHDHYFQSVKPLLVSMPKAVSLAMNVPLDLHKKFHMEVHPESEKYTRYCILPKLEKYIGRELQKNEEKWLLNGVAVNDDSASALATSVEESEVESILTFYRTNFKQKRKERQRNLRADPVPPGQTGVAIGRKNDNGSIMVSP